MAAKLTEYDYYKVHAKNKQGWKTVKVEKGTPFCLGCGSTKCAHIGGYNISKIGSKEI